MSGFLKVKWRSFSPAVPAYILLGLSFIAIASYIIASVMIRPNGDDYGWLDTYHQATNWFSATYHFMQHDNGRYAQNLSIAIPYGIAGKKFLLLTGILSIGIFVGVCYTALRALQKLTSVTSRRVLTLSAACVVVLAYTSLSLTYAGIRGELDNTFQDFLWYAGFITYTFPVLLLIWLSSLCVIFSDRITRNPRLLIPLYIVSIVVGLYDETVGLLYFGILVFFSSVWLITRRELRSYINKARAFLAISGGALTGLVITYTSPASTSRRNLIENQASLTDVIVASLKGVRHFITHYLIPSWSIVIMVLCIGALVTLFLVYKQKKPLRAIALLGTWGLGLSCVCGVMSLFVAFVSIFKGYGLGGYIVPRFEVFYNIWFTVSWVCLGALIGCVLIKVARFKLSTETILPAYTILITVIILCTAPAVIQHAATRVKKIAVYSAQWDELNATIEADISKGQQTIYAPTIDIGDGYRMPCGDDLSANWLGATKANYYNIKLICTPGQK